MEEQTITKILSLARIWWFGPLSGAVIAIGKMDKFSETFDILSFVLGLTNIVGVCLSLLYYLSNLTTISLNLILVLFSVAMLLFANMMVMLGAVKSRQQFLIPWLAITSLSIMAAVVYSAIKWDEINEFRVRLRFHNIILNIRIIPGSACGLYYSLCVFPRSGIQLLSRACRPWRDNQDEGEGCSESSCCLL